MNEHVKVHFISTSTFQAVKKTIEIMIGKKKVIESEQLLALG